MGVAFAHPLAVGIVGIGEVFHALLQGAAAEPGQPALAPGGSPAVIGSRTAHGVVGNGAAAKTGQLVCAVAKGSGDGGSTRFIYILPFSSPTVKKKPPRPYWSGRLGFHTAPQCFVYSMVMPSCLARFMNRLLPASDESNTKIRRLLYTQYNTEPFE